MSTFRRRAVSEIMTWTTGACLALTLVFIVGLFGLIAWNAVAYFWPRPLVEFELADGRTLLGEVHDREERVVEGARMRIRVGNRDLTGLDFEWIDENDVVRRSQPRDVLAIERREWGPFYGRLVELHHAGEVTTSGAAATLEALPAVRKTVEASVDRARRLERGEIGDINTELDEVRLARRRVDLEAPPADERAAREAELAARETELIAAYDRDSAELGEIRGELEKDRVVAEASSGRQREIAVADLVRVTAPNRIGLPGKVRVFGSRVAEFLFDEPRESNTEGGVFPAIFGTVMMVFLMSIAVVPLGVVAAVYLREYAREGPFVRLVRIAVNNLAGVPSIVFGVFGLGFFVYLIGGTLDQMFHPEALPNPTYGTGGILWASLTLALLTVPVVIVASEEGLAAVPKAFREGSRALGATHFETLTRVVIPAALPGILTGTILAMARAAGEVAPLMIVGMVKLAPALPVDHHYPFVHLERKFMHLGFHIYDVGFQSPNVEAAKPLVFATALLLVGLVFSLNATAIVVRERLRSRFRVGSV